MNAWIFQGNPDVFDINAYIEQMDLIVWSVRQKHLASSMSVGDPVFLWRAKGSTDQDAGVIALARIDELPREMPDDAESHGLWTVGDPEAVELRVRLSIVAKCLRAKEVIKRDWIMRDPLLSDLRIFKMRTETNYLITPKQEKRLSSLVANTGRTWSQDECLAALWAYSHTYDESITKKSGGYVATVALAIGRAVDGVYNKLMNFRSIDPRDNRAGLSSINQLDKAVWDEFFDLGVSTLDDAGIDAEYTRLWGTEPLGAPLKKPTYTDFGEAPDDDPNELRQFAARVRKGQPKFRKKLLKLYDNRCAISGDGPAAVLEAAHIVSHAESGLNHSENGLLLRADIHSLLDAGLLQIDPYSLTLTLDDQLKSTSYWNLNGRRIRKRTDGGDPSADRIRDRWPS